VIQQGLHKLLMEDAVKTAANQTGMKHQGMEPAGAALGIPAAMQSAGVDEKTFSGMEMGFVIARRNKAAALSDQNGFPFFVPVPGNIGNAKSSS
jgi:hypothetical protein